MRAIVRHRRSASATERLSALGRRSGPATLLKASGDPSLAVARHALGRLASDGGPAELDALRELVWTCDPSLAPDVARTLRTLGDRGALATAAGRLRTGPAAERCRAARVLQRLADRDAIPSLCEALGDRDESVRSAALDALASIGSDYRAARASAALVTDSSAEVRRCAVRAVGTLSRDPAPAVNPAIDDSSPRVRREVGRLASRLATADVARLLGDRDLEVRCATAAHGGRGSEALLASALASDPQPRVRLEAAQTLGLLGGDLAVDALISGALEDSEAIVRAKALRLAGEALPPQELAARLRDALADSGCQRRDMALRALAKRSVCLTEAEAAAVARDVDPDVRLALAQLADVLVDAPEPVLALLAADEDRDVRHAAASGQDRSRR